MLTDYASDQRWWFCTAISYVANPLRVDHTPALQELSVTGSLARPKGLRQEFVKGLAARSDLPPEDVMVSLFHNDLLAKWRFSDAHTSRARRDAALDGYIERNRAAAAYGKVPEPYAGFMREFLRRALPEVGEDYVCTGRFGPGKVYERWPRLKRLAKLSSWYTTESWTQNRESLHPKWRGNEPRFLPFPSDVTHVDADRSTCRLSAVPKDVTKDRLITVEPAYRSFLQQRVRELILCSIHSGSMRNTSLDCGWIDTPSIQRRRALSASKEHKELATVDLSDASDHITWSAVTEVFPLWLVLLLEESRSQSFEDPRTRRIDDVSMFAGMGNATTFMVETLFFHAAVYAIGRAWGIKPHVTVFGDDIICNGKLLEYFTCMEPFMHVNEKKTFRSDDTIRESCGIFAYQGVDVTYPHIRGFRPDWDGALGMRDFWQQWRHVPAFAGFVDAAAVSLGLRNWPCLLLGYPSVSTDKLPYDALPRQRINHDTQSLELRVTAGTRRCVRFKPRPGVSSLFGMKADEEAIAYLASQCGMIKRDECSITGDPEQGRSLRSTGDVTRDSGYALGNNEQVVMKQVWRTAVPPDSDFTVTPEREPGDPVFCNTGLQTKSRCEVSAWIKFLSTPSTSSKDEGAASPDAAEGPVYYDGRIRGWPATAISPYSR